MEDYKEIIKQMLLRDFSPYPTKGEQTLPLKGEADRQGDVINLTTFDILQMVQGIIPQTPIDEHDVFEVMQELGFEYKLIGFQHITNDKEFVSCGYRWILFKK